MARYFAAAFGVLWTVMAIAITSSAPSEGPFVVAKIVFPAFGVLFVLMALFGGKNFQPTSMTDAQPSVEPQPRKLSDCTHCGAALQKGANVSPHGDVLCAHCGSWYNIHAR